MLRGRHVIFCAVFLAPAAPLFRGLVHCTATAAALANSANKLCVMFATSLSCDKR